ncbi:MAG: right-handed parallel beta-helix repeat-containing protein [Chitinispirillaceae bacterium]|nr:right-handed parallel beta-helix repeat-containing protein [Chitinispirillaceae bacterium]
MQRTSDLTDDMPRTGQGARFLYGNVATILLWVSFVLATTIYVTPTGSSGNSGTSFNSALDHATALSRAGAGDTVLLQGGAYAIPYNSSRKNTIVFSKSGSSGRPISLIAYNNSRAIFNFSYSNNSKVLNPDITSYGFDITGSYWYFRGIYITKAGYQGAYVSGSYITFENCAFYENWNSGLEINKGGSNVTAINCDAYRNFDGAYKNGSMADGFAPKQTQGPGNTFIGCRAWENSDDGYDTYDSPEKVTFENCWAFRNGVNVWSFSGFEGNGNGFKIGGNSKQQNNKLTRCIVFGQPKKGFDQNNNAGGLTLYNCLAYANNTNFALGGTLNSGQKHDLANNVSLSGPNTIANATERNNTWNSGFSVSASDFESLDTSLARAQRNPDGTLPESKLFRLKTASALIDAGANVGVTFTGKAPDIGCFESGSVTAIAPIAVRTRQGIAPRSGDGTALFTLSGRRIFTGFASGGERFLPERIARGFYCVNTKGGGAGAAFNDGFLAAYNLHDID